MKMIITSATILQLEHVPIYPLSVAFTDVPTIEPDHTMLDIAVSEYMSTGKRNLPDGDNGPKKRNCIDFVLTNLDSSTRSAWSPPW